MATLYRQMQIRRDTAANFTSEGTIPVEGQMVYITDTADLCVGNGSDIVSALPTFVKNGAITTRPFTMTTARILGRTTAATGAIEELTNVPTTLGGTGITSYTTGDILYASASNVLSKRAAGTDGYILRMVGGVPDWSQESSALPEPETSNSPGDILTLDSSMEPYWASPPSGTLPDPDSSNSPGDVLTLDSSLEPYWAAPTGGGASVTISTTAPVSPGEGDLWWDSTYGTLKIYYDDGDTEQWVDASGGGGGGGGGGISFLVAQVFS